MKIHKHIIASALAAFAAFAAASAFAATSVTHHHITWTFDKDHQVGQFVNGDPWVVGPVKIISITNDLNDKSFLSDEYAVNGSMINPIIDRSGARLADQKQGFDERIQAYRIELNAALPNEKPLSKDNPIVLKPDQSLVSVVSWLWRDNDNREEGAPAISKPGAFGGAARPTLRAAAVLTALAKPPPEGTFRPAYAGDDKRMFNVSQLRLDRLAKLDPVEPLSNEPQSTEYPAFNFGTIVVGTSIPQLVYATTPLWLDHVPTWYGGEVYHPALNMPNYGREICWILSNSMLALHTDWEKIDGKPDKKPLLINIVQIGIDLAGAADAGTYWPADGGHDAGRKHTILFAGLLLDDKHMMDVGNWETRFQDNEQVYYTTEADIAITNDPNLDPKGPFVAISKDMVGLPDWRFNPYMTTNAAWANSSYRILNNSYIPALALAIMMTEDGRKHFNHEAYFDYADRIMSRDQELMKGHGYNSLPAFAWNMWKAYRDKYPSTYDKKWDDEKFIEKVLNPPDRAKE